MVIQMRGTEVNVDIMSFKALGRLIRNNTHITLGIDDRIYLEFIGNTLSLMVIGIQFISNSQSIKLYDGIFNYTLEDSETLSYRLLNSKLVLSSHSTVLGIKEIGNSRLLIGLVYIDTPNTLDHKRPVICNFRILGDINSLRLCSDKLHGSDKLTTHINKSLTDKVNYAKVEYGDNEALTSIDLPTDKSRISILDMNNIVDIDWYQNKLGQCSTLVVGNLKSLRSLDLHMILNSIIANKKYISLVDYNLFNINRLLNGIQGTGLFMIMKLQQLRLRMAKTVFSALTEGNLTGISVIKEDLGLLEDYSNINLLYTITTRIDNDNFHFIVCKQNMEKASNKDIFSSTTTWIKTVKTSIKYSAKNLRKEQLDSVIDEIYYIILQGRRKSTYSEPVLVEV